MSMKKYNASLIKALEESQEEIRAILGTACAALREEVDSYDDFLASVLRILDTMAENYALIGGAFMRGDTAEAHRYMRNSAICCHILSRFGRAFRAAPHPVAWCDIKPHLLFILQCRMVEIDREFEEIKRALEGQES